MGAEPSNRHPWTLRFESTPFARLSIEGCGGPDGAGFGMATAIWTQGELGADVSAGFDDLFYAPSLELFGVHPRNTPSRVWLGAARTWKWARVRGSGVVESVGDQVEYVPFGSVELLLPAHASLGWETSYSHESWRHHAGASVGWDPLVLGFGLTEIQSWLFRNGEFGWWNEARPGSATGIDNPGVWFSVGFHLPRFERPIAPPPVAVKASGPTRLDSSDLLRLETMFVERQVRADLAELALRLQAEGVDPLETGALRRRILSGAGPARAALWNIASDPTADARERVQALATAASVIQESDLPALEALVQDRSPRLRAEAALALGRLTSARAVVLRSRLRLDPEAEVRAAAGGQ